MHICIKNTMICDSLIIWLCLLIDGIPNDGIPDEDIVTVHIGITVVYVTLATAGLMFAVVCLVFNLVFRQKRLAKFAAFLIQSWIFLEFTLS